MFCDKTHRTLNNVAISPARHLIYIYHSGIFPLKQSEKYVNATYAVMALVVSLFLKLLVSFFSHTGITCASKMVRLGTFGTLDEDFTPAVAVSTRL